MHLAAMYNHSSCIDALLKHKSEAMNMQNNDDMTPLQVIYFQHRLKTKVNILYILDR